jgi:hypothetical protein
MWQKIGAQMMAASSLLMGTPIGQLLLSSSLGPYLLGVGKQADADLEMGAINALRQAKKYTNDDWDVKHKPLEVIHSVKASRLTGANNTASLNPATSQKFALDSRTKEPLLQQK